MNSKTVYNKHQRAIQRINDLFSHAKFFGTPYADMLETMSAIRADLKGCPRWVFSYLDGMWKVHMDTCYRCNLVFGFIHEGKFYSTHSNREDYYGKHMTPEQATNLLKDGAGNHYWITEHMGIKPL